MRAILQSPVETARTAVIAACAANEPEPVDAVGTVTKAAVEAIGLGFALQLIPTISGRRSLIHKETRS
jgi:hypothetical protein